MNLDVLHISDLLYISKIEEEAEEIQQHSAYFADCLLPAHSIGISLMN